MRIDYKLCDRNRIKSTLITYIPLFLLFLFISCKADEENLLHGNFPELTGEQKEYTLRPLWSLSSIGKALFLETENNTTVLSIKLSGISPGTYQVLIYEGPRSEQGDLLVEVGMLETDKGVFEAEIKNDINNNTITYDQLLNLDGHLEITDLNLSFSIFTDLGINELTGKFTSFPLISPEGEETGGTVEVHERISGESLIRTKYDSDLSNEHHSVRFYAGAYGNDKNLLKVLNPIDPQYGFSDSHIGRLNTGDPLSYEKLILYDGHVKIHLSNSALSIILAYAEFAGTDQ